MEIKEISVGLAGANCYFLINDKTKEAVVIDPGGTSARMRRFIEESGIDIKAILITHGHFDHIMGIDNLEKDFKVPVYIYKDDEKYLGDPVLNSSTTFLDEGFTYHGLEPLEDNQILHLAGFTIQVLHTPGHTEGSCCYYLPEEKVLFSGDTLFRESVGRTDLPGGSDEISRSVQTRLFILPDDVTVYPGHNAGTTIGHEKRRNPYVQGAV